MSGLKEHFEQYVGNVVEDPDREEYTICATMHKLEREAMKNGMAVKLSKNSVPYEDDFSTTTGLRQLHVDVRKNDMNKWVIADVRLPETL